MNLANKYRPQSFSDVVGQENTIKILQNQIQTGQIKNGYLFTGGAGTGKTTIARIFAKEINRKEVVADADSGLYGFTQVGEIIEIDAASNNGVDHVRELRENCKFKPINSGYKVYVIDECHMLSTGAFNALLKTLEEPPAHAVFLLCTTDPQKIPATILSRVQRFKFARMTVQQIVDRLAYIMEAEMQIAEREAINYIAKLANGGMRDAISILDTCLGYIEKSDDEIPNMLELEDVINIVGASDYENFINLTYYKIENDNENIIRIIEETYQSGKDLKQFVKGYIEFIIDIEKYQIGCSIDQLSIPSIHEDRINVLGKHNLFEAYFEKLMKLNEWIKYDPNPKVFIEGAFISI